MSGPSTPDETEDLFKPYETRGHSMKIEKGTVYMTRKSHIASIRTDENKMAHIINTLDELVQGGEVFEPPSRSRSFIAGCSTKN